MNRKELNNIEEMYDYRIPPHVPVVIRVDGKNFKRVTERLNKPFDNVFTTIMQNVTEEVAAQICGCDIAYTQSDEITFILHNREKESPFLGNRVQKMASVVASMVSNSFYRLFLSFIMQYQDTVADMPEEDRVTIDERISNLWFVLNENPIFDARVYMISEEDEADVIEIRQNNCINNSINSMAHYYLDSTTGKSQDELLKELYKAGHRWEDLPEVVKFGYCIVRDEEVLEREDGSEKIKKVWIPFDWKGARARQLEVEEENRQEARRLAEENKSKE